MTQQKTDLMDAAARGDTAAVIALLDEGAAINEQDETGMTALMYAIKEQHPQTARALLERGADANRKGKFLGYTALVFAVKAGSAEMVEMLLDFNVDPQSPDAVFALGVAQLTQNIRIVELLKKQG